MIELVTTIHLPMVCSVRGWATGLGCSLALAADFTVADEHAVFWEPFMARGFTPDSGATRMPDPNADAATIEQVVKSAAAQHPDTPAVIDPEGRITYRELDTTTR